MLLWWLLFVSLIVCLIDWLFVCFVVVAVVHSCLPGFVAVAVSVIIVGCLTSLLLVFIFLLQRMFVFMCFVAVAAREKPTQPIHDKQSQGTS